jgi:dTDP-4-dehydrorhamnose reductase
MGMPNLTEEFKSFENLGRTLVIGGDGVLGTALRSLAHKLDLNFVFTSRSLNASSPGKFLDLNQIPGKSFFAGFSTIIYLAQSREYRSYPEGLADLVQLNIIAPTELAKIAEQIESKFVFCSTGSVYPLSELPSYEESPIKPQGKLDSYSASKLFGEKAVQKVNPNSLILRPFFIFGMSHNNQTLLPSIYKLIVDRHAITLKGENGLSFNPISSIDAAAALLHLISQNAIGIYNLAGHEITNLRSVANLMSSRLNLEPNFIVSDGKEILLGGCDKLLESGYQFSKTLDARLSEYVLELELSNGRFES